MTHRDSIPHFNPLPQNAPGSSAAIGHSLDNSIPLSIFPVATDKFCICFCGMPGRGKTHISRRLGRYLSFFHAMPVGVYQLSNYRRELYGAVTDAEWFDPANESANAIREECQRIATADVIKFLHDNVNGVAIFDSTNPTHERRVELKRKIRSTGAKILWIEVSNDDEEFLTRQYHDIAHSCPDFAGICDSEAFRGYSSRVDLYKGFFEPIDCEPSKKESRWSYIKCDHAKQHFVVHNVKGYLLQKVVNFIMNLRTTTHAFYLSRHGQSEYNNLGRIGGDSGLSAHGWKYAEKLAEFVESHIVKQTVSAEDGTTSVKEVPARLWTSTMRRTKETAKHIQQRSIVIRPDPDDRALDYEWVQMRPRAWHHLDELFAGSCDGMTYEEIEQQYPEEWERRAHDKLAYRYPRGESYLDVIARLEPIIIEMERHQEPLLIIAHQGILRIIYAFYMGLSRDDAPYVSIPLNCVTQLVPAAYGCTEQRHVLYKPSKEIGFDGQAEPTARLSSLSSDINDGKDNSSNNIDDPPSH